MPLGSGGWRAAPASCEVSHKVCPWLGVLTLPWVTPLFGFHIEPQHYLWPWTKPFTQHGLYLRVLDRKITSSTSFNSTSSTSFNSSLQTVLFFQRNFFASLSLKLHGCKTSLSSRVCLPCHHMNRMYKTWVFLLSMGDCWFRLHYNTASITTLFMFIISHSDLYNFLTYLFCNLNLPRCWFFLK